MRRWGSKTARSVLGVSGVLLLVSAALGNEHDVPTKFWRAQSDDRIINGEEVDGVRRRVEWIVSLRWDNVHKCGGAFIAPIIKQGRVTAWSSESTKPEWAVTAAHCVLTGSGKPVPFSRFSVLGGSLSASDAKGSGEIQSVVGVYIPGPNESVKPFNIGTLESDIALLRLSRPKKDLNVSQRRTIRLPTAEDARWLYVGYTAVHTSGWGRTATGADSDRLHELRLPVVAHDLCAAKLAAVGDRITQGSICAGFLSGEYDACKNDSGGPLYYRPSGYQSRTEAPVLAGIVSGGHGCAVADLPGVYTSVAHFEPWLKDKIEAAK
jgi:secreted trypsin-like serine protease